MKLFSCLSFVMPDLFFVHLPLHERKKIGESLYSFQTWPLVCNFICISWCAIITNYWHILMEWVSLAEIFALYHWKKIAFRVTKDFLSRQISAMKNKSYNNSKRFYWIHELKWFYQYKNLWSCIAKHRNKSLWKEVCDLHTCDSI